MTQTTKTKTDDQPVDVKIESIGSISTKNVGYSAREIRKLVEGNQEVHFLARLGGVALEHFQGTSKHGEWYGFRGIFTIVNRDGKAYSSSVCYLPKNITMRLLEQFKLGVIEVQFMVDIKAIASDKNASGYAFNVDVPASEDALKKAEAISSRVIGSMGVQLKALAAPKKPA